VSSLQVGSGGSPFGIADLATMLVARSKGADVVALMSVYAKTGQTFYWLKRPRRERRQGFPWPQDRQPSAMSTGGTSGSIRAAIR